jgi:hypothetical protein
LRHREHAVPRNVLKAAFRQRTVDSLGISAAGSAHQGGQAGRAEGLLGLIHSRDATSLENINWTWQLGELFKGIR